MCRGWLNYIINCGSFAAKKEKCEKCRYMMCAVIFIWLVP